jgi:hypothetical protein
MARFTIKARNSGCDMTAIGKVTKKLVVMKRRKKEEGILAWGETASYIAALLVDGTQPATPPCTFFPR